MKQQLVFTYRVFLHEYTKAEWVEPASSWIAFFMVTITFVLLADLIPKRLALINPEGVALRTIGIMQAFIFFLKPIVWFLIVFLIFSFI